MSRQRRELFPSAGAKVIRKVDWRILRPAAGNEREMTSLLGHTLWQIKRVPGIDIEFVD